MVEKTKSFNIPKQLFVQAYKHVKANAGSAGVDQQSLEDFERNLKDIARWYNPVLQGWLNYYGKYTRSALYPVWRHFNQMLGAWAMRKYRRFRNRKTWAAKFMEKISKDHPNLFVHWRAGMVGGFV